MTPQEISQIRQAILDACVDIIGTYTLPTGETFPAIAASHAFPPPNTAVEGLEIVITADSEVAIAPLCGSGSFWEEKTQITLKQWDASKDTNQALGLIAPLLGSKVTINPRVLPDKSIGNIETRTIEFSHFRNTYEAPR